MKKVVLFIIYFLGLHGIFAQENEVLQRAAQFIKLGVHDGQILSQAYMEPVSRQILYTEAQTTFTVFRKERKFSLYISGYYFPVPKLERRVNIPGLGLNDMEQEDLFSEDMETVYGDLLDTRLVSKLKDTLGNPAYVFDPPYAIGYKTKIIPFIDLAYSITSSTNLNAGFFYTTSTSYSEFAGFSVSGFRLGMQQNVLPLLGLNREKTEWHLTLNYASAYSSTSSVQVLPGLPHINADTTGTHQGPYEGQTLQMSFSNWTIVNRFSYRLTPVTRLYAGVGYAAGTVQMRFKGTFPAYRPDPSGDFLVNLYDIKDPEPFKKTYSRIWGEAGVFLEGERLTFHLQGSYGKYWGVNIGVGYKFKFELKNPDIK